MWVRTPRELHVVRRRGACCHFLEIKLCPIVHSLSVHRLERFEVLVRQRLTQHVSKRPGWHGSVRRLERDLCRSHVCRGYDAQDGFYPRG